MDVDIQPITFHPVSVSQDVYYTNFPFNEKQYAAAIEDNGPWARAKFWRPLEGEQQYRDAMWARDFSITWEFPECAASCRLPSTFNFPFSFLAASVLVPWVLATCGAAGNLRFWACSHTWSSSSQRMSSRLLKGQLML